MPATSQVKSDDPLVDTKYVAAYLGIHLLSVYRNLRENPEFPVPIKAFNNRLSWRKSQIDEFIESRPKRVQNPLTAGRKPRKPKAKR